MRQDCRRQHNTTAGQIYESLIRKERRGDFLGHTVQVVPHVTDEIKSRIRAVADGNDVVVTEIGGTVGDIESLPFLEAVRQFRLEVGPENCLDVHLTLVPYIQAAQEMKTKPTQHSVATLRSIGLQPDVLLCRTERPLPEEVRRKISGRVEERLGNHAPQRLPDELRENHWILGDIRRLAQSFQRLC